MKSCGMSHRMSKESIQKDLAEYDLYIMKT